MDTGHSDPLPSLLKLHKAKLLRLCKTTMSKIIKSIRIKSLTKKNIKEKRIKSEFQIVHNLEVGKKNLFRAR